MYSFRNFLFTTVLFISLSIFTFSCFSQEDIFDANRSVARNWNEALLFAIRKDYARPTVHARNLFHSSALMYDLWAVHDSNADPYFLGNTVAGFYCPFDDALKDEYLSTVSNSGESTIAAINYGMYRLLSHRFLNSPGVSQSLTEFVLLAREYGVDINFSSTDIANDGAAALGNYLAECIINFGLQDGSNEAMDYANSFYQPVNAALDPTLPGNPNMENPNNWQPLKLDIFVDQAGNETDIPPFLGAEWGKVAPFSLNSEHLTIYNRDDVEYWVYLDPGAPALLTGDNAMADEYKWGHSLVALWSSHLDPADGVMWDISPGTIGNSGDLPNDIPGLRDYYKELEGGVSQSGHGLNPATGEPYEAQLVPRGDYTRVLAEFWADGPDSETPPGHWFTILNQAVTDHPEFVRQFAGLGEELSLLEWDIKAYFTLGGALHDAAISAWGIKGWYDYIRPVSAIRYMADQIDSDSGDIAQTGHAIELVPGFIEVIEAGDDLAGENAENVGEIKLYTWRGPDFIDDENTDVAGVGWILAKNWWPYQRPSFVTPPFAGYVSGHSVFSRAAAEVLTAITNDAFFPGGFGEFVAKQNEFLVFEEGPSMDIRLQWATYRDASDQTSLSRIWGGIHPPVDDVPGRKIGVEVASIAVSKALSYIDGSAIANEETDSSDEGSTPGETAQPEPEPLQNNSSGGTIAILLGFMLIVLLKRRFQISA